MALSAAINGISLLPEDSWNTHHTLAFRLHLGNNQSSFVQLQDLHFNLLPIWLFMIVRALCEHCCKNSDTAVEICNELIAKRAQTITEEVEAYVLMAEIYLCQHKYKVAPEACATVCTT